MSEPAHQPYASFLLPMSFRNFTLFIRAANGRDQYRKNTPSAKAGSVWIFRSSPIEDSRKADWFQRPVAPSLGRLQEYEFSGTLPTAGLYDVRGCLCWVRSLLQELFSARCKQTALLSVLQSAIHDGVRASGVTRSDSCSGQMMLQACMEEILNQHKRSIFT